MLTRSRNLKAVKDRLRFYKKPILGLFNAIHTVVFFPVALIFWVLRINILRVNASRIGHLCADLETYARIRLSKKIYARKTFLLVHRNECANEHLLEYFKEFYSVVRNPIFIFILKPMSKHFLSGVKSSESTETLGQAEHYSAKRLGPVSPLLSLSDSDEIRGKKALEKLGIPENSWYVCIHSRESGYSTSFETKDSKPTDFGQGFRNSEISSYHAAIRAIEERGGWSIRVGDGTMKPFHYSGNFVDYALSDMKSDWLDVFLGANNLLFLGNTSGLFHIPSVFGAPIALTNMIPITHVFPPNKIDIAIPKLFKDKRSNSLVPFKKVLQTPLGNGRDDHVFRDCEFEIIDNSEEDICDLVEEALDRRNGVYISNNEDDERQEAFRKLFQGKEYSYYGLGSVGSRFLKKYEQLL